MSPPTADDLDLDHVLNVAVAAAQAAGAIIRAGFQEDQAVVVEEKKNASDLVTATDKASEECVLGHIRAAFPDHNFIGEEESAAAGGVCPPLTDAPTWMVDPLDGTTNFVHKFPFVCVSIGLVVRKQVVVGVVYNPVLQEMFTAVRGRGAFLNGRRISTSATKELQNALLGTEVGTTRDTETFDAVFGRMRALVSHMRSLRCCGSCALNLCSVAVGRMDAFYEVGFGGCWDVAAGALIVQEAGGQAQDPAGGPFDVMGRRVLASNAHLGSSIAAILAGCKTSSEEPGAPTADAAASVHACAADGSCC